MPRTTRVPAYRLHKPTGQAVVTLDGRDRYLGRHGTPASREAYDRLVAEWLRRGRQTLGTDPSGVAPSAPPTVGELILAYARHCEEYYRDAPAEREKVRLALRPLRRLYGSTPADRFGPLALRAVRAEMCKTLSRVTVNQRVGLARRMFKWAAAHELVPASVHEALRAVEGLRAGRGGAREGRTVRPVPDEVVERTLPHLGRHVAALVRFQRLTGCRPGEACRLRPRDLDRSGPVWSYMPASHKTAYRGHTRVVHVGPRCQAVLAPLLEGLGPDEYVFSPRRAAEERYRELRVRRKSKVPPSQECRRKARPEKSPGERYTPRVYYHAVLRACDRAGVPRWHPHQLRHTAATEVRRAFGVEVARAVLGQRHVSTAELYAEIDGGKVAAAAARLG